MVDEQANIFAYGTLLFREVMRLVAGRCFEAMKARLDNHARYLVKEQPYPGIISQPGASVEGILYLKLDEGALELIDLFEGDLYQRHAVEVVASDGLLYNAYTYVVPEAYRSFLSHEPWSAEFFRARHLGEFLAGIRGEQLTD